VTWEVSYEADDLPMMRAEYDDAFADIVERLIARFGGHVIERTVDAPRVIGQRAEPAAVFLVRRRITR